MNSTRNIRLQSRLSEILKLFAWASMAWSGLLLSCGAAGAGNKTPREVQPILAFAGHGSMVVGLVFSEDGKHIVSVSSKDIRNCEVASGKEIHGTATHGGNVAAVSPDGQTIVYAFTGRAGLPISVRAAKDGKETLSIEPFTEVTDRTAFGSVVAALAFSPDGHRFVAAGRSGLVGGPHGLPGGVVKIWETATGKQLSLLVGPRAGITTSTFAGSIALSADGQVLAIGTDGAGGELPESGQVVVWNLRDKSVVQSIHVREEVEPGEFNSAVTALALAPDGKQVVAAYGNRPPRADGLLLSDAPTVTVRVWDVATSKVVHTFQGHKATVGRLAYSRDGRILASAAEDQTVRLWNAATGQPLAILPSAAPSIRALAFSPDGRFVVAGGGNNRGGTVQIWPCPAE